jgi:hypothetical protein
MSMERQAEMVGMGGVSRSTSATARYMLAIVGGAATALALFCATYGALYVTGYLPPPPLSNNVCTEEKLVFLRRNPPADPNFLVVGSSVAWRNIDSEVIARELPGARPVNGGFCGMQVHQSAFISDWFIDRWPGIKHVLLVVSPLDYASCKGTSQAFDPVDARELVFEAKPLWNFYLRYFDPVSLHRNIKRQAEDRRQESLLKVKRSFTQYGDGPLDTDENRGLFYSSMPQTDPDCFAALRAVASKLDGEGRTLMVVATPVHPAWKSEYDPEGAFLAEYSSDLRHALEDTGARLWNADEAGILDSSAFTDAIHVRWSSATVFTGEIVKRLKAE